MDSEHLETIAARLGDVLKKLDALIRLSVMQLGEGKSQSDQIWFFAVAGLAPREIAEILGTSPNAVRVALSKLRKSRRRRRGQKGEDK
jgi:hypothetical protein